MLNTTTASREEVEERIREAAMRASEEAERTAAEEAKARDEREKQQAFYTLRAAYKRMAREEMPEAIAESAWIEPNAGAFDDYGERPAYRAFVNIYGQTFSAYWRHGRTEFAAVQKCPRCGGWMEWSFYDTAGLGGFFRRLAAGEDPFDDHRCPAPPATFPAPQAPAPPTAEQRLVAALRELMAEEREEAER